MCLLLMCIITSTESSLTDYTARWICENIQGYEQTMLGWVSLDMNMFLMLLNCLKNLFTISSPKQETRDKRHEDFLVLVVAV